jgi:hypothetical protein
VGTTVSDPTCIGRVSHVLGATVTVRLDRELAGVAPLWRGRLQPVGQVGSLVLIPQGPVQLLATVTLIGISDLAGSLPPVDTIQRGDRWLRLQLLGEIDALNTFQRGVSTYPGLDDPVHFPPPELLATVYPQAGARHLRLGQLAGSAEASVALEARSLVTRHSVIVGSTGSGKTSAVATILQQLVRNGWSSANVVVIDPHGEYVSALNDLGAVSSVVPGVGDPLCVPYWALPAADILTALTGVSSPGATLINRFTELVAEGRRAYAEDSDWLEDSNAINSDTPIPFNLHQVWHRLDSENRMVVDKKQDGNPLVVDPGDAQQLIPAQYQPYGAGGAAPFQATTYGRYQNVPAHIRSRMRDPRFGFFLHPDSSDLAKDPFVSVLEGWLGGDRPISVLDFSGVPSEVADLAIGVVLQLLFELSLRSNDSEGVGRNRPVLVVMEEAHRFLGDSPNVKLARESVNRIAREGRKYGIGMMLVSQRPSELPDTALSQAGTVIALRLTNSADQARVKAGLPDTLAGLAEALPSLRTGEAVVAGEAVSVPSRVRIDPPNPMPRAADPDLTGWRDQGTTSGVAAALARWRGIDIHEGGAADDRVD